MKLCNINLLGSWRLYIIVFAGICRSDYRKSLPGEFIKIRLKVEQNCCLFMDVFNSAVMNDLFMTFTSRLKVDVKCVYQQ